MLVEIQCLPRPAGLPDDPYKHVDAAISRIIASGLTYEVGPLGTSIEGSPDEIWPLLREVHEACLESGAEGIISVIKLSEAGAGRQASTIAGLTGKFRS